MATFGNPDLVTVKQVETMTKWSRRTIYRLVAEEKIHAIRLGSGRGLLYVSKRSVAEYMKRGNETEEG